MTVILLTFFPPDKARVIATKVANPTTALYLFSPARYCTPARKSYNRFALLYNDDYGWALEGRDDYYTVLRSLFFVCSIVGGLVLVSFSASPFCVNSHDRRNAIADVRYGLFLVDGFWLGCHCW